MKNQTILFVFSFLLFFSCVKVQEKSVVKLETNEEKALGTYYAIYAYQVPIEKKREMVMSNSEKKMELHRISYSTQKQGLSWQAAHLGYVALVNKITDKDEKIVFYQMIANAMARHTNLLEAEDSPKKIEVADYYLKLLIEAGSIDAELINAYAQIVKNTWTKEEKVNLNNYIQKRIVEVEEEKLSQKSVGLSKENLAPNIQELSPKKKEVVNNFTQSLEDGKRESYIRQEKGLIAIRKLAE
jgi:hypothetical protein